METYDIHPYHFEELKAKLAKMEKRARKLGVEPIKFEVLGEISVEIHKLLPSGRVLKFQEPRTQVRVEGEAPKLAGWTLVAKVETVETEAGAERLISCVPGEDCPDEYREGGMTCDHCGTKRRRKEVFILRHDDGRHTQVGRQCISDFLGGVSPELLMARATYLLQVDAGFRDEEGCFGPRTPEAVNIEYYLCCAAICIRRLGWMPRKAATCGEATTADDAWQLANPIILCEMDRRDYEKWVSKCNLDYQDRDKKAAAAALAWAKAIPQDADSSYLYNLGVACRMGYVTHKTRGLVASAIASHANHLEREIQYKRRKAEEAKKARGLVGEVKKREVFKNLTVKTMRYFDGQWGATTLVVFEDAPGNLIKWFASKSLDDLEEGDTVDVKATVKKHDEYKGVPETIITRAVIL